MSAADLFPTLHKLSRTDKLKVMQFLVQELATEEETLSLLKACTSEHKQIIELKGRRCRLSETLLNL